MVTAAMFLAGCTSLQPGPAEPTAIATALVSPGALPTLPSLPPTTAVLQLTLAPTLPARQTQMPPSPTLNPLTPTPVCDRAGAGIPIDITIPDDTHLQPGENFTKTWRLQNAGACTWTTRYSAVWFSGEQFRARIKNNLSAEVAPGHSVDVSVDMVAPDASGNYQSNWKVENETGVLFGIGPNGDAPFWVRIQVVPADATPTQASPDVTPTVAIYINGLANFRRDDALDLDTNQVNRGAPDDVLFSRGAEGDFSLSPLNGARLGVFGAAAPTLPGCQVASLSGDPLALDALGSGTYLCYRTNQGLPGSARIVFLNTTDATLSVEITTWSIP